MEANNVSDEIKYNVHFYRNEQGEEPVRDYLNELVKKKDKDSRIKLNKIRDYVKILRIYGTRAVNHMLSTLKATYGSLDL